jgi:hypothetical protein
LGEVNPRQDSGQALWRLYSSNKKKVILDAQWAWACVRQNGILTLGHSNDWGGFKVKGTEQQYALSHVERINLALTCFNSSSVSGGGPSVTPPIAALNLEGVPYAQIALTPPSTPQPQTFSHDVTPASSQESQNPFVLDHNSGSFLLPPDMNDPASTLLSQIFAPGTFPNLHSSWTADHHIDFGHDLSTNLEYVPPWDEHGRSFNASLNINVGVTSVFAP